MFRLDLDELELVTIRSALEHFRDRMAEPPTEGHAWTYVDEDLGCLTTEETNGLLERLGVEAS